MKQKFTIFILLFIVTLLSPVYSQTEINLSIISVKHLDNIPEATAEIGAFDASLNKFVVTDASTNALHIYDLSDPSNPTFVDTIDLSNLGGGPNSVAVYMGHVYVAIENANKQQPGLIADYLIETKSLENIFHVGTLPDMIHYSHKHTALFVANEGEPNDDYTVDPEGSVSIISGSVQNVSFGSFNSVNLDESIRIFGPDASVAQDLEPEYIAESPLTNKIYVSCQENNAIVEYDLITQELKIFGLGYKDHSLAGNAMDASNEDGQINLDNYPVKGMYLPDAIAAYAYNGNTYLVTANEGDSRDYDGYSEETRVKNITLDPVTFPNAAMLQEDENMGRLKITTSMGDTDGDNDYDELYSFGARSFSIFDTTGTLVFDSGDDFETYIAANHQSIFNCNESDASEFDQRSDDKGPEPEGLVLGEVNGNTYVFLGLERVGGIMVYNITNPMAPSFVQYINPDSLGTATIAGPEGLEFVSADESPNGKPLLIVSHEVSGSIVVFEIAGEIVPVELTSFSANVSGSNVNLKWSTATETNNKGFYIERSADAKNFVAVGFVDGNGTTTRINSYSFADKNIAVGKYNYRLKQVDFDGTYEYSDIVEVKIGTPLNFRLQQNYPNPFNPSTKIGYSLPETSFVTIKIYDILGNEIASLVEREVEAGNHSVNFSAGNLASGLYIYKLTAGDFTSSRKMTLIK